MPPKGTKRKETAGNAAPKKSSKKNGDALPSVAPDALAMPHMKFFETWSLEAFMKHIPHIPAKSCHYFPTLKYEIPMCAFKA